VDALFSELFVQDIHQGAHLPGAGRRRNDEEVGEPGDRADVDQGDVLRLPVGQEIDDPLGECGWFQAAPPGMLTVVAPIIAITPARPSA
jgi:hypothetical protein